MPASKVNKLESKEAMSGICILLSRYQDWALSSLEVDFVQDTHNGEWALSPC